MFSNHENVSVGLTEDFDMSELFRNVIRLFIFILF